MERLIFIYDTNQAEFLIRHCGKDVFKVGKGNAGDVCISFYNTELVRNGMARWKNNNK